MDNTVVSYFTARQGRDVVANARKIVTQEWWPLALVKFELVVSDFVEQEAVAGDASAAQQRLASIRDLTSVATNDPAIEQLALSLVAAGALPSVARYDALHIATAAVNGVTYVVTWNYTHLANPEKLDLVDFVCRQAGFEPPRIVTPDQLVITSVGDNDVD